MQLSNIGNIFLVLLLKSGYSFNGEFITILIDLVVKLYALLSVHFNDEIIRVELTIQHLGRQIKG
jgi:hypothetical protein